MENIPPNTEPQAAAFVCGCPRMSRAACAKEPFYGVSAGKPYCVLHYPGEKDNERFQAAVQRKLAKHDFSFRSVWFPPTKRFSRFEFNKPVDFVLAVFNDRVRFRKAKFTRAFFNFATFNGGANFAQVNFREGVNFSGATFVDEANFQYAHFSGEVDFTGTAFRGAAKFYGATFKTQVRFAAARELADNIVSLDLQFARIEKPDLVYFHSLFTTPSWFVNVDVRRFDFVNVDWNERTIEQETTSLTARGVTSPHRMLAITYRRLAVNAEENHRYDEASDFRFRAMDASRLESKQRFELRLLKWFYRQASGYGEQVWRALAVLLGILIVFAALYTQVGFARWQPELGSESDAATVKRDEVGAPLTLGRALSYSGAVMTLQQPDPRPATNAAHALVLLETILGPVQAALLALAIRRKFMR